MLFDAQISETQQNNSNLSNLILIHPINIYAYSCSDLILEPTIMNYRIAAGPSNHSVILLQKIDYPYYNNIPSFEIVGLIENVNINYLKYYSSAAY